RRRRLTGIGAWATQHPVQHAILALLKRLVLGDEEFRRELADRALALDHVLVAGALIDLPVVQRDRLIDGGVANADEAIADVVAVGDRVVAAAALEVLTGRDVPADRRQRLVVAAAAAHVVRAAASFRDRDAEFAVRLRDIVGRLLIRARTGARVVHDGVVTLLQRLHARLNVLRGRLRDRALARDRIGRRRGYHRGEH